MIGRIAFAAIDTACHVVDRILCFLAPARLSDKEIEKQIRRMLTKKAKSDFDH